MKKIKSSRDVERERALRLSKDCLKQIKSSNRIEPEQDSFTKKLLEVLRRHG